MSSSAARRGIFTKWSIGRLIGVTVGFSNQDIPVHMCLFSLCSGKPAGFLPDLVSVCSTPGFGLPDFLHLLSQWIVTDRINVLRELFWVCPRVCSSLQELLDIIKFIFWFKISFSALLLGPDYSRVVQGVQRGPHHGNLVTCIRDYLLVADSCNCSFLISLF